MVALLAALVAVGVPASVRAEPPPAADVGEDSASQPESMPAPVPPPDESDPAGPFWLGEDVGAHFGRSNGLLVGWEGGGGKYCGHACLGGGLGAAGSGSAQAAALLRVGYGQNQALYYLQAGPLLMHGQPGVDLQVGADWALAALWTGLYLEPADGPQPAHFEVVVGGRVSIEGFVYLLYELSQIHFD